MIHHSPIHQPPARRILMLVATFTLLTACSQAGDDDDADDAASTTPVESSSPSDDRTTSTSGSLESPPVDDVAGGAAGTADDRHQVEDPDIPQDHHVHPDVPEHLTVGDGFALLGPSPEAGPVTAPHERIAEMWAYEYHLALNGQSSAEWFDRMRPWSTAEVVDELESFNYTAPRNDVEMLTGLVTDEDASTWHITGQTLNCNAGDCRPSYAFAMVVTVNGDGHVSKFEHR